MHVRVDVAMPVWCWCLHGYRLGPISLTKTEGNEIRYTCFLLAMKLLGMMFIASAVIYAIDTHFESSFSQPLQWHDALYFSVITATTIVSAAPSASCWLSTRMQVCTVYFHQHNSQHGVLLCPQHHITSQLHRNTSVTTDTCWADSYRA